MLHSSGMTGTSGPEWHIFQIHISEDFHDASSSFFMVVLANSQFKIKRKLHSGSETWISFSREHSKINSYLHTVVWYALSLVQTENLALKHIVKCLATRVKHSKKDRSHHVRLFIIGPHCAMARMSSSVSLQCQRSSATCRILSQVRCVDSSSFSAVLNCFRPSPLCFPLWCPKQTSSSNSGYAHHNVLLLTDVAHCKVRHYFLWPSYTQYNV